MTTPPTRPPQDRAPEDGSPVDGAGLLEEVHAALTRYVVLPSVEAAHAVVLWIAASHGQPSWAHAPRLVIRAPEKRCGKSRLLDLVEALCRLPLITVNASPAAVYRAIGTDDPPTLLVDEADTIFGGKAGETNDELRGLLNAGHQRNRPALRWDTNRNCLERIPTFAMAALAGIGAMPDTIEDRAVVVRMRRRAPGETVAPYRHRRDALALHQVAARLTDWIRGHAEHLERTEPAMPVEDRAADTWEPLIAVADLAGPPWPERARHAALVLTAEASDAGQVSTRVRLLTDVRAAFITLGDPPAAPTTELLAVLNDDPEAPWPTFGPTGLTGKRFGDLLREFGIRSDTIRFPVGQAKGYRREDFTDAWSRYAPDPAGTADPGVSVPSVPSSFPQVSPGTDCGPVRIDPYQHTPAAGRASPGEDPARYGSIRTTDQSVPPLTSQNELGTDGTDTPAPGAVWLISGQPLADDGSPTAPTHARPRR